MCEEQVQDLMDFAAECVRVREDAQHYAIGALSVAKRHLAAATDALQRVTESLEQANAFTLAHHTARD